jgi:hypothetical protein
MNQTKSSGVRCVLTSAFQRLIILGRNFNYGEVIQLVLKSPSTGHWLPFKFVQMVMMHELAHNKQMNHSKAFWAIKNGFSSEMNALWAKGYTGDGLWGRGVLLENGKFSHEQLGEGEVLPEHMCGGGFVSRASHKRKIKPKITYKEQKERRIRKKFGKAGLLRFRISTKRYVLTRSLGVSGMTLGADDEVKVKLEKGKRPVGKPRVAGSARGRELRAAAALSRFETAKEEPMIKGEDLVTDSDTDSDNEEHLFIKTEPNDAVDINGSKLLDLDGKEMVKVCEDEDKNDDDAQKELQELRALGSISKLSRSSLAKAKYLPQNQPLQEVNGRKPQNALKSDASESSKSFQGHRKFEGIEALVKSPKQPDPGPRDKFPNRILVKAEDGESTTSKAKDWTVVTLIADVTKNVAVDSCPVCSVEKDTEALTCCVCSHVLRPNFVPNSWKCQNSACQDSMFLNAGDVGLCGLCGSRR